MTLAVTKPPSQPKKSVTDIIESSFEVLRTFQEMISKSKSLRKDTTTFCTELRGLLEDLKDKIDSKNGEWFSLEELEKYEEIQQRIFQCEAAMEDINDSRNTIITMLRLILDDNTDVTLRNAIEYLFDSLGPVWEKRPLPSDPLDLLTLVN